MTKRVLRPILASMSFGPPFSRSRSRPPVSLLDEELAQEKASALGRMGRALEAALAALAAFDATASSSDPSRAARRALVGAAGRALWELVVQREACGLRDTRQVLRDYRVPAEVQACMGFFPAAVAARRDPPGS